MDDYQLLNRANWDERAPAHAQSPEYAVDRLVRDRTALSDVVRFDLPRLGDIAGLRTVHLQCHIGTDTISLSRLGAQVTGLDFSPGSLAVARRLAARCGADVDFIQADVYEAVDLLGRNAYDLVYTGIGALCWLPSVQRWAAVVAALLRPGGRLFVRDGHPMLATLADPRRDGSLVVEYPYFERFEPMVWDKAGTYVTTDAILRHTTTHQWNHGLAETITAVQAAGLLLQAIEEHDSVAWEALPGQMERLDNGEYRLADRPWRLPHSFTLIATQPR